MVIRVFFLILDFWDPALIAFAGALLCGLIYGISSGFRLLLLCSTKYFQKIFPDQNNSPTLSNFELFYLISWFPLVFIIRGTSGYFNSSFNKLLWIAGFGKRSVFKYLQKSKNCRLAFFQKNQEGDLLSRITADTAQLQAALLGVSNDLVRQPVTFIGAIVMPFIVMAVQREGK